MNTNILAESLKVGQETAAIDDVPFKKVRADEPVYVPTKREYDADYDLYC